jgi:hypothetical protein
LHKEDTEESVTAPVLQRKPTSSSSIELKKDPGKIKKGRVLKIEKGEKML